MPQKDYPQTPDGRYFVSKGVLWRCTDPSLDDSTRRRHVKALMQARMAVRRAEDDGTMAQARKAVEAAKRALGERGPVWWDDGAEPLDRMKPEDTVYADWWAGLPEADRRRGTQSRR